MTTFAQFSDLTGKRAVLTGAGGLLGPVWIRALLEAGVAVLGLDLFPPTSESKLGRLVDQWGDAWQFAQADVRDRAALERVRNEHLAEGVDIVINNAGIDQPPRPGKGWKVEEFPWDDFQSVLAVNLGGAFQVAQVMSPALKTNDGGSIINIGSLYATVSSDARNYDHMPMDPPFIKPPAYGASKAGLHNLTRYLAAHWGDQGIRVNTLSPGGIAGGQDSDFVRKFTARVPLRRMGEHADLVAPLLFLASDASAYITGQNLQVDGGYTVW